MLEVNAIYFILLAEGFTLLALILVVWIAISLFRLRGKRRAVADLEARIGRHAAERAAQAETFLQAVYGLENEDLHNAVKSIAQREDEFFGLLLQALKRGKNAQIGALDGALERLIDSYKSLPPRADEMPAEAREALEEAASLRGENEKLRCELSLAKNKMSALIDEFGNMFGGGKDHELALEEIKQKVTAFNDDADVDFKLQG